MHPAVYELRLRGPVSARTMSIFEEMDLRSETLLSGVIQDQAALHGVLDRIRDLGLEIIEVHQIRDRPDGDGVIATDPPPVRR